MKHDGYALVSEMCGKKHGMMKEDAMEEDMMEEDYDEKEKATLSSAFDSAKGMDKPARSKIIKKAFSKVSG